MEAIEKLIEAVRAAHHLDPRSSVFDIRALRRSSTLELIGHTTENAALQDLVARAGRLDGITDVIDSVVRLPIGTESGESHGVVRAALAPVYAEPAVPAPQLTQLVLGSRVDLLAENGDWWRIRAEDGYIGWVHRGYVMSGSAEWAQAWERGVGGEPAVSLGAELVDEDDTVFARLPWGARITRLSHDVYELPDGRRGRLVNGEAVPVDRLFDRFPPRGDSVARTARRWLGSPYLWGGVAMGGVDCSGFTQAVCWMHGIAMPRDSDMQARMGVEIDPGAGFTELRPGDLLFFAEQGTTVSHVAIALHDGHIIHASIRNGGVALNSMSGELPYEAWLRSIFVTARRVLPD